MSSTRDIQALLREQVVPAGSTRYAVVIGIEQYRDERLSLRCARADAEAMYALMVEPDCGMFAPENVTLLLNENAGKEAIWNALATLRRKAGKSDTIWVYYAGHAAPEGNDFYWVPFDGNVDDLYATGLSRRQISQVLDDMASERVVTFLDCCHAAATAVQKHPTRAVITADEMLSDYQGKGRVVISGSDGEEKSIELPEERHGAFTHYLTKGLRGAADRENTGVVHLDGLWTYLEGKVADASQKAGNRQTPKLLGEHSHKLALSLNPLETHKKRQIANKIRELVGLDDDQLTTEEARYCLEILRRNPQSDADRDLASEFSSILDDAIRMKVFKRLVQVAMTTKVPLSTPPVPVRVSDHKDNKAEQKPPKSLDLASIRQRYALSEQEALQLVDAWSVEHPEYLNPISQHAELVECKNWGGFVIQVQAMVETRELELHHEPFTSNASEIQTERIKDKWSVPIIVPSGFEEATETYVASVPQRILTCTTCGGKSELTCPTCNGSGEWICNECQGKAVVQCQECDGTGWKKFYEGHYSKSDKCQCCHGNKVLPCTACKGVPHRKCPNCGGSKVIPCKTCSSSGQLAEIPCVQVEFSPLVFTRGLCEDNTFTGSLERKSRLTMFNDTTTSQELPWVLEGFPVEVVKQGRLLWKKVNKEVSGKIHRMRLDIGYVPGTTLAMNSKEGRFTFNIIGTDHNSIHASGSIPKDNKYLKQQRINKLRKEFLDCQEKLPAARIIFCLFMVAILASIGFGVWAWFYFSGDIRDYCAITSLLIVGFSGAGLLLKLFSDEIGPGLLRLLAKQKRLRQELKWEESQNEY